MFAIPSPIWTPSWAKPQPRTNRFRQWFNAMADDLRYGTGGHLAYKPSGGDLVYDCPAVVTCPICAGATGNPLTVVIAGVVWDTVCRLGDTGLYAKTTGNINGTFTCTQTADCVWETSPSAFATYRTAGADATCTVILVTLTLAVVRVTLTSGPDHLVVGVGPAGFTIPSFVFEADVDTSAACPTVVPNNSPSPFTTGQGSGGTASVSY